MRYDLQRDGLSYLDSVPPPSPITIIHGNRDVDRANRGQPALCQPAIPDQVRLVEVDADHDLNGHLDLVWEHVQSIFCY